MNKSSENTGGSTTALSDKGQKAAQRLAQYLERGAKGEQFGVNLLVGPEEAEFLLAFNPDNRAIRPTKIAQFTKDMRHGRWRENGESIIVSTTGELNDGQHRLQAVLATKIPQKFLVAFGYPRESRFTVDSGAARSAGEHLHMAGMSYGKATAAAAKIVLSYEQTGGRSIGGTSSITSLEQQDRAKNDELLQEIVIYCVKHPVPFIRTSLIAAAFYILSRVAPQDAKKFIDGILTGVGLNLTDPAYLVRDRLLRAWTNKSTTGKRMTDMETMETIFRGWNYYARGKAGAKLQIMGTFPVLEEPRGFDTPVFEEASRVSDQIVGETNESIVPYGTKEPVTV